LATLTERIELDSEHVILRQMDDVVVVYCDQSGATHEFSDLDGWVLEQLATGPTSLAELKRAAREFVDVDEDSLDRRLRQIIAMLNSFALLRAAILPG
jgi:hypothetical protein